MKRNLFWMLSVLLMLGAATMVMTSCGDDDEPAQGTEQGGQGGEQGGDEETGPLTMAQAKALLVAQGFWTYQVDGVNYYLWFGEADGRGLSDNAPVFKFDYSLESESGDFREGMIKLKDVIDFFYKNLSAQSFQLEVSDNVWVACKAYKEKTPQGVEAVDLGLPSGTLWANMNVGASKPEEYGDYLAWGETKTKSEFTEENYKWGYGENSTKYSESNSLLEPQDDAAYANWGAGWCMPSEEQIRELIKSDNTSCQSVEENGVNGLLITSKRNENSIFLPAVPDDYGYHGYYESNKGNLYTVFMLRYETYSNSGSPRVFTFGRYNGLFVRPVRSI